MNCTEEVVYESQGFGGALPIVDNVALLIIDFVNGFADPDILGGGNICSAIEATIPLLAEARERDWPVVHTRIVFADDGSDHNVFAKKVPSMGRLTEAHPNSQIVSELAPLAGELVVCKRNPSAFAGTLLAAWLAEKRIGTLLVAGCVTSGCVRASVVDAMSCGFYPVVLEDCVGDRALGPHEANLFDMRQKYASVETKDNFLQRYDRLTL
ncbi:isochorismatase family protein [Halomonas shantousis]